MLIINPLSNSRNENRISFGYNVPNRIFRDIRDIPSLKCACCGGDMLTKHKIKDFTQTFLAGSKRALENSAMNEYRGSAAFEFVQLLSEIAPKKTIRELVSIPENKLKIRQLDSHSQIDLNMIALISDGISVKAPRVMQKLEKYRTFFSKEDDAILELMDMYASMYPKKTFAEIFRIPEIAQHHQEVHKLSRDSDAALKIDVFKRLKELSDASLNPEDAEALKQTNSKVISILNNEFYMSHIKRELVRDAYKEFVANATGKVPKRKLMKMIEEFPCTGMTPDRFVSDVIKNQRSDMDIVSYFVKRLQATREHFKAKSENGEDRQKNIIILCQKCNFERSNLAYPFFLRFHPEMIQNIQRQINKVITYIKHGKLEGYEDYPVSSKRIILEGSDNILRPKINEYLKFRKKRAEEKLEAARATLEQDKAACERANSELTDIDSQIKKLEAQIRKLRKKRKGVAERYRDTELSQEYSQGVVDRKENALSAIRETIDNDRQINEGLRHKKRKIRKTE